MFINLYGPKTTALVRDLFTDGLATELAYAWTGPSPSLPSQVEDLPELTPFLLENRVVRGRPPNSRRPYPDQGRPLLFLGKYPPPT
jgi:hypothetical protein